MTPWIALLLLQTTPLEPLENPGLWVSTTDYPSAALRSGAQGTVHFRLEVDAEGSVSSCTVVEGSGSAELDETTCPLITARAHFKLATDSDGQAVPSSYRNRVSWTFPERSSIPLTSFQILTRFEIESGRVKSCVSKAIGNLPDELKGSCERDASEVARRSEDAAPGRSRVTLLNESHLFADPPFPPLVVPAGATTKGAKMDVEIAPEGTVQSCRILAAPGDPAVGADCREIVGPAGPFGPYLPDPAGNTRRVIFTLEMMVQPVP